MMDKEIAFNYAMSRVKTGLSQVINKTIKEGMKVLCWLCADRIDCDINQGKHDCIDTILEEVCAEDSTNPYNPKG